MWVSYILRSAVVVALYLFTRTTTLYFFFLLSLWKRREWLFLSYKDGGQWRPVHPSRPTSLIVCVARELCERTPLTSSLLCALGRAHSSHTNLLSKHLLHTNLLFFSVVPIFDRTAYSVFICLPSKINKGTKIFFIPSKMWNNSRSIIVSFEVELDIQRTESIWTVVRIGASGLTSSRQKFEGSRRRGKKSIQLALLIRPLPFYIAQRWRWWLEWFC